MWVSFLIFKKRKLASETSPQRWWQGNVPTVSHVKSKVVYHCEVKLYLKVESCLWAYTHSYTYVCTIAQMCRNTHTHTHTHVRTKSCLKMANINNYSETMWWITCGLQAKPAKGTCPNQESVEFLLYFKTTNRKPALGYATRKQSDWFVLRTQAKLY